MKNLLANPTQSLIDHSTLVAKIARWLASKFDIDDKNLIECSYYSALVHDAGKAIQNFQKNLSKNLFIDIIDDQQTNFDGPYHHELSWLCCNQWKNELFKFKWNDDEYHSIILNAVYWHHGKPQDKDFNFRETSQDIVDTNPDIKSIQSFLETLFKIVIKKPFNRFDKTAIPNFFETEKLRNSKIMFVRSCVIFADRFVSGLSEEDFQLLIDDFEDNIDQHFKTDFPKIEYTCPENYDKVRFGIQEKCAIDSGKYKTVISRSPAGFGKTLQLVLRNLYYGGKMYVVCPRNVVAESVYKAILQELTALNVQISVELFLTGERKDSINAMLKDCSSRIVVTNFDNIFNPFYKNADAYKGFDILFSDIVFDEYHEVVSEQAMFGMFTSFMYFRNNLQNAVKTFLLSATPSLINLLWEDKDKTTQFPNPNQHFPAAHDKKYVPLFVEDSDIPSIAKESKFLENTIIKHNSIKNAQEFYMPYYNKHNLLIHSNFIDDDKAELIKNIYKYYGKNSSGEKPNVVSSPIIGASFDISFMNGIMWSESPEADIQLFGRINRWGIFDTSTVCCVRPNKEDKSNDKTIDMRYDRELSVLWFKHFKEYVKTEEVNLDKMYEIYNNFHTKYNDKILKHLQDNLEGSLKQLSKHYFPIKYPNLPKIKTSKGKSLRNSSTQHYIIVNDNNNNNKWVEYSFTLSYQEFKELLSKNMHTLQTIRKIMKSLVLLKTFDYSSVENGCKRRKTEPTQEFYKKMSKNINTPFPVLTHRYDKILGLVKNWEK